MAGASCLVTVAALVTASSSAVGPHSAARTVTGIRQAADLPIPVTVWHPASTGRQVPAMASATPVSNGWPAGHSYSLTMSGGVSTGSAVVAAGYRTGSGWSALGDSGISIGQLGSDGQAEESTLSGVPVSQRVRVDVLGDSAAPTLRISNVQAGHGLTALAIRLPRSVLAGLYGADYATRLRWVQVANPQRATSLVDARAGSAVATAGAELLRTESTVASSIFLTGLSGASSATGSGDFTATPLSAAASWQVSAQTGSFAWSYPLRTPPAAAGPAPQLALSYDSQSVDGETGSTNNQPSAIGDGWSLAGAGFIDRSYVPCNQAATPISTGDLCWFSDNATVSFAGHSGRLIKDSGSGTWHLQSDDNTRIEYLTGGSNGTVDGGYWKLTTTDGTQYFFGRGTLPGGGTTGSAWTVPVCGTASTGCSGSGATIGPFAAQGWRWNLDYVLDSHGNAEAFYYAPETGSYVKYSDTVAHPSGTPLTSYVRGGQLSRVEYGIRATATSLGAPSGKVLLETGTRCESGVSGEPAGACSSQPASTSSAPYWPDVPWDQYCTSGTCSAQSPTFWTTQRLADVRTQVLTASGYQDVDQWNLTHTFPKTGDGGAPALWLAGINHLGLAGATAITLPATTFGGLGMQNRVWPVDGYASLDRFRVSTIHTESGATISVTYSSPADNSLQCTAGAGGTPASPQTDAMLCYQAWWTPPTAPNAPPPASQEDWFNTYIAMTVSTDPGAGQDPDIVNYLYTEPGWRLDSSPTTAASKRTWSDFAGFKTVEVRHGNPATAAVSPLQSITYTFFRGLDDDPIGPLTAPASTRRSASLTSSDGSTATVTDSRWYAGRVFETVVRNGVGGAQLSDTVSTPWSSPPTASATLSYNHTEPDSSGTPISYSAALTITAQHTGDAEVSTIQPLAAGGTRTTTVTSTHDSYGRVTGLESATPDAGTTCATTSYADSPGANLLGFPKEVLVVKKACAVAVSYPVDAISDTRTSYDDQAFGQPPTLGEVSTVAAAKSFDSSGPSGWLSTSTDYDSLGRPTTVTDPLQRHTTTAYTPAVSGPLTSSSTTNPVGWPTTTDLDPSWGNPLKVTDVMNNLATTAHYDALGRTTGVWQPGNPGTTGSPLTTASQQYSYSVPTSASAVAASSMTVDGAANVIGAATTLAPFDTGKVSWASASKLLAGGTVSAPSFVLYDGLLRQRQTQAPSPKGVGEVVSDSFYNAQGEISTSWAPWYATGTASGTLVQPGSAAQIPSQTFTDYDGAGRSTLQQLYTSDPAPGATVGLVTGLQTSWAYPGSDRTDVTPPTGAAITSTFTDSRGRTTELRQFHGPLNASTRDQRTSYDRTSYGYDPAGRMTSMADDAGHTWSWTFDVLGRQTQAVDPDKGTTSSTYDDGSRLQTTTDSRTSFTDASGTVTPASTGVTLYYNYDDLDRKTGEFLGSAAGRQLAGWSYDTLSDGTTHEYGQLTSATRYTAGADGPAYTSEVTGFDTAGRPTGTAVTIPNDPSVSPAMQWLAGTYTTSTSYNVDGSVATVDDPAAGGLEEDTLSYSYDQLGNLTSFQGGTLYGTAIKYTGIGQLSQIQKAASTTSTDAYGYDAATGRTTSISQYIESTLDPAHGIATGTPVSNRVYSYDQAGNVSSEKDSVTGDNQCFSNDYAQRLTEAWTPVGGNCADTRSDGSLAGPAPYWQSYSYDSIGDRTILIRHATTGGGTDSTDSYQYASPAVGGTPLPNAVSAIVHSGAATDNYSYDPAGNTVSRPGGQTLSYDAEGRAAQLSSTAGTQNDIYDADGNRLLQTESAGTNAGVTLYLGDTELHVASGASRAVGTRTYSVLGEPLAVRVATPGGTYPTNLYWKETDLQHTADTTIRTNATSPSAITTRYLDPFGAPRGTAPSAWPDNHGYLNAPTDTLSGTTHLGARDYDPATGRFLTVDPILNPQNPQQNNGYSYAWNNPVDRADPSGMEPRLPGHCFGTDPTCNNTYGGSEASPGNVTGDACVDYACRTHNDGNDNSSPPAPGHGSAACEGLSCHTSVSTPTSYHQVCDPTHCELLSGSVNQIPGEQALYEDPQQWWCEQMTTCDPIAVGGFLFDWSLLTGGPESLLERLPGRALAADTEGMAGVADTGGMAGVRAAGQTGEDLAGIVKNTDRIPSASGTAAYRIPDELNASTLGEVKNVARQSYTYQLRDFQAYAQSTGRTFNLYVRRSTTFSGPLQEEIDAGRINVIRILAG